MRGYPNHNFDEFHRVAAELRLYGWIIESPAELDLGDTPRAQCLMRDIELIIKKCDGVIVIPGWDQSPGASLEVATAWTLDLPVVEYMGEGRCTFLNRYAVSIPRERQYYGGLRLFGMMGYAQSGKDTFASFLIEHGFQRVAFADTLRDMLYALDPMAAQFETERVRTVVNRVGWDRAKTEYPEIRSLLQRLGTEAGRDTLDPNLWVLMGEQKIEAANGPVVVTDCRFPNETYMIRRRGGTLIWVDRPGVGPANGHASEHSVSRADADIVIENKGTLDDLRSAAEALCKPRYVSLGTPPVSAAA